MACMSVYFLVCNSSIVEVEDHHKSLSFITIHCLYLLFLAWFAIDETKNTSVYVAGKLTLRWHLIGITSVFNRSSPGCNGARVCRVYVEMWDYNAKSNDTTAKS